ncbi:chorion class CB protein PC404 [Manduca sexta]|uniref:Uncharacterized protein n=1 Tax=Manduca sexta TaxID=7130 RepID=A0A921YSN4_MANSE|nr:chorion class CB protein PC404 [Manduca sexta]KAG6444459.1 hypothetical protein O3G_MSEX003316 [Manduca sexta]KAG6444460.1 hypothetical protein O3G_MSEX003316 [Manduca sexta]
MTAGAFVFLCFAGTALSQCIGRETLLGPGLAGPFGPAWGYDGLAPYEGLGYGPMRAGLGPMGPGLGPMGPGLGPLGIAPANGLAAGYGGGLAVTSASPIAPTGLSVTSENAIEGTLAVVGQLPFLGAVATDGAFPTVGAGAVSYGCGDGAIGIVAEAPIAPAVAPAPMGPALGYGPGMAPFGYGPAMASYRGPLGNCGLGPVY